MQSSRPALRRVAGATAAALAVGVAPFVVGAHSASAAPTELFISEYVEGLSSNKALEIYNGTGGPVDLAAGGYSVQVFSNGNATPSSTTALSGTVASGDVFVMANGSANAAIKAAADVLTSNASWNGNDAVVLRKGTTVLDVVGQVGFDPGAEWGTGLTSTMDNTLRRKPSVQAGDPNGADAFDPAAEWDGFATDTVDGLGAHTVDATPTTEPTSTVPTTVPTTTATTTSVPTTSVPTTTTTTPPVDPCTVPITPIPAIQGSGDTVAKTGTVTTRGVVVADYEGASPNLRGFYLQDPTGDGDPATSDGIFVFEGSNADSVKLGDLVTVTGTAGESNGQSQISLTAPTTVCAGGQSVAPTDVSFPVASTTALERYEGMLVQVPQTMSVTEHFQLGRFGQVVVSSDGRLAQPTNVVEPGDAARALQAQNTLRRLVVDDGTQAQNPDPIVFGRGGQPLSATNTLRGGDTVTGLTGVMTYTWGGNSVSPNAYRLRPVGSMGGQASFVAANERPGSAPAVGGSTRVVGMNLLNFFNTLDTAKGACTGGVGGAAMDCRGANTTAEFDRQWHKTVTAVNGTDADVVAFMEMENDGYGDQSAVQFLVDRLNEATQPGTWAFIDADARTGQTNALGTDAIKVGMLYKPARVTPVGTTAALNTTEFTTGGDPAERNRPSLAQAFRDDRTGGVFVAVANHLKSKGSACSLPDQQDGQGNCAAVRTKAAELLSDWLATDPTKTGDSDVLLLGDMNSYAKEDPIAMFEKKGYTNLIAEKNGAEAYSYAFDGQWGYLDHALGSATLDRQVTGVGDWHVNADEPSVLDYNTEFKSAGQLLSLYRPDQFRISDHDPVVVGLDPTNAAPVVSSVTGPTDAVSVGEAATVTGTFTDADALDTHTATVAWGDGTTTTATLDGATVSGDHVYTAAGVYTVTVTVRDAWGHDATGTTTVTVYDRGAGFLTGSGWFVSPKGAVTGDPSATGKAQFAVSARYAADATRPDGSFTLTTPGLSLASTRLDWLVVTGRTARVAGPATVGGASGYRFEAFVRDGSPDTLRVVVRDATGAVVYDGGVQPVQGQLKVH